MTTRSPSIASQTTTQHQGPTMTQSPSLPKPDIGTTDDEFGYTADQMNAHGLARYEAGRAAAVPEGLSLAQEPKYTVNGSAIVNRASGEAILADEPVFIFRARDWKALHALREYQGHCVDSGHRAAVTGRIQDFKDFAAAHPERMREPDTAPTQGAEGAEPQAVVGEASERPLLGDSPIRAAYERWRRGTRYANEPTYAYECIDKATFNYFAERVFAAALTPSPTPTAPQEADALREALAELEDAASFAEIPDKAEHAAVGKALIKARAALAQHQPATLGGTK